MAVDQRLVRLLSRRAWTSTLYYLLFNRGFGREHRAVLRGRVAFENSRRAQLVTTSVLRRNTHRIEKGLIMNPRRPLFGLSYIGETIQAYERAARSIDDPDAPSCLSELQWSHDVLERYFDCVTADPRIDAARKRFQAASEALPLDRQPARAHKAPYRRDLEQGPAVSYEQFLALSWRRRSVRWFAPRSVSRDLIHKAVAAASLAPSACNRQPYYFHVFDAPDLVARISRLPPGTRGFDHQFPVIIAVIGELRNYYGERDRHLIYVDASLAVMNFVNAAETLGLASCCINWPDIEGFEARAVNELKLADDQRPIMFLALGHPAPDGLVPYSQKKPLSGTCRFNFEEDDD